MFNKEKTLNKAYERLTELYGKEPDINILNRYFYEKMFLERSGYLIYLSLFGRVRKRAREIGEHIVIRGTNGSSFISYLLGATDINPLPLHKYCPKCHHIEFLADELSPYDYATTNCACGNELRVDGHNIPFEMNLYCVLGEYIEVLVSEEFFAQAEQMIREEMADKKIITLIKGEHSDKYFALLTPDGTDGEIIPWSDKADNKFWDVPRILLVHDSRLGRWRELEKATKVPFENVQLNDRSIKQAFKNYKFDVMFNIQNEFSRNLIKTINPSTYMDCLKMIGFAHGTHVWLENGEKLLKEGIWELKDIPAFRDDIFMRVLQKSREKSLYDVGFAYEVAENTYKGKYANKGIDSVTQNQLIKLGFDDIFCEFLKKINYMFPKAHCVLYLKESIILMWYKINYPEIYDKIMKPEHPHR